MKTAKTSPRSRKAGTRLVATDSIGRPVATAPALELAPVRFRIGKILVPVDFSEPSQKALHYARPFAEQFGAGLTLVHVVEPITYPMEFGYIPIETPDLEKQRLTELGAKLAQLGEDLGASVPVESFIRVGRAWKEIVETAKTQGTDLIIVATHGYTGLQHALLGSVAEKIVRHAPCPVLVVRTEEHDFV
jgi:nucleotide-binding universal stress UspA family protein